MKMSIKRLLAAALLLSASSAYAHTNKTFLLPRTQGVNLAHDQAGFWELAHTAGENRAGGALQATAFYNDSVDHGRTGSYFGVNAKSTFAGDWPQAVDAVTGLGTGAGTDANGSADLDLGYLIHDAGLVAAAGHRNEIKLRPTHRSYGMVFGYRQGLDRILKGLYLSVKLPVAWVENDLGLQVNGPDADLVKQFLRGDLNVNGGANGPISGAATSGSQTVLTRGLIKGKRTASGVADPVLALGYSFLHTERFHLALSAHMVVPTGNQAAGIYAFEPIYGNGRHFGLGGGAHLIARVWGDEHCNVKLSAGAQVRYLFENEEIRTLGVIDDGKEMGSPDNNWGQYTLLGDRKAPTVLNQQFVPAANVLTQKVDVTPGTQLDGLVTLSYNHGGWTLDLGYNLYVHEDELVKRKEAWDDEKWAYIPADLATNGGGTLDAALGGRAAKSVVPASQLDVNAARTPAQLTNKVYASIGYLFRNCSYPVLLAGGGHYEHSSTNAALSNWGIQGKIGVAF